MSISSNKTHTPARVSESINLASSDVSFEIARYTQTPVVSIYQFAFVAVSFFDRLYQSRSLSFHSSIWGRVCSGYK